MPDNYSGLNVSTGLGDGMATVHHWERFYKTVDQINQRDLTHQKQISDALSKSQFELSDVSKGIRPKDIPLFTKHSDDFVNASILERDKDVQKDPVKLAEVVKRKSDAYVNAMNIASQSKKAAEFKAGIIADVFKSKGVGYKAPEDLDKIWGEYDNTDVNELSRRGMDTPNTYLLPHDTYPKEDYDKHVFGEAKTRPDLQEIKDANGRVIARQKNEMQYYTNDIPTIASKTAQVIDGVQDVRSAAKRDYDKDLNLNPDVVKTTFENAHKVIQDLPTGAVKPVLPNDYIGYAAAKNVLRGQPKQVGTSGYEEDPEYKRDKSEAFRMKMAEAGFKNRKDVVYLQHTLKKKDEAAPAVNTQILYEAAKYPNKNFTMKAANGKDVVLTGREVLDAGIQAVAGDNPKNVDAVQLDRSSLTNNQSRRRIIEKLLPSISESEKADFLKSVESNTYDSAKKLLDKINEVYHQDISLDDINRYSIPVFIHKQYITDDFVDKDANTTKRSRLVLKPTFVSPGTHNFGQFHSVISNQVTSKKKGQMSSENPNFIGALRDLSNDNDDE